MEEMGIGSLLLPKPRVILEKNRQYLGIKVMKRCASTLWKELQKLWKTLKSSCECAVTTPAARSWPCPASYSIYMDCRARRLKTLAKKKRARELSSLLSRLLTKLQYNSRQCSVARSQTNRLVGQRKAKTDSHIYRNLIYDGVVITYQAKSGLSITNTRVTCYPHWEKNKFGPQTPTIIKHDLYVNQIKVKGNIIFKNLEYKIE